MDVGGTHYSQGRSLITNLITSGFITGPSQRKETRDKCRAYLLRYPDLFPALADGRREPNAYLEHGRHADPVVRLLIQEPGSKDLPAQGFLLRVHARYDTAQSPADEVPIGRMVFNVVGPVGESTAVILHAFNSTGTGSSGSIMTPWSAGAENADVVQEDV